MNRGAGQDLPEPCLPYPGLLESLQSPVHTNSKGYLSYGLKHEQCAGVVHYDEPAHELVRRS